MRCLLVTVASPTIGVGHFFRLVALYERIRVRYPMSKMVVKLKELPWIEEFASVHGIELYEGSELLAQAPRNFDVVILDYPIYHADSKTAGNFVAGKLLALVTDSWDSMPRADILINPNLDDNHCWSSKSDALKLTGLKFALVRQIFRVVRATRLRNLHTAMSQSVPQKVLISVGGTDHREIAPELGMRLAETFPRQDFTIMSSKKSSLIGIDARRLPANLSVAPYTSDITSMLDRHDLVVTAAGSSLYNYFVAGIPTVAIATASDQLPIVDRAVARGLTSLLGDLGVAFSVDSNFEFQFGNILDDQATLREKTLRAAQSCDGLGALRVMKGIENSYLCRV